MDIPELLVRDMTTPARNKQQSDPPTDGGEDATMQRVPPEQQRGERHDLVDVQMQQIPYEQQTRKRRMLPTINNKGGGGSSSLSKSRSENNGKKNTIRTAETHKDMLQRMLREQQERARQMRASVSDSNDTTKTDESLEHQAQVFPLKVRRRQEKLLQEKLLRRWRETVRTLETLEERNKKALRRVERKNKKMLKRWAREAEDKRAEEGTKDGGESTPPPAPTSSWYEMAMKQFKEEEGKEEEERSREATRQGRQ